jgi:hypothetical protein
MPQGAINVEFVSFAIIMSALHLIYFDASFF